MAFLSGAAKKEPMDKLCVIDDIKPLCMDMEGLLSLESSSCGIPARSPLDISYRQDWTVKGSNHCAA